MLSLSRIFQPAPDASYAQDLYIAIVAQSRNPFFYSNLGVADSLDGRFELVVLHMFLLMQRLRQEDTIQSEELLRNLSEALFDDMDRSLREMGVGDTGVSRRIRHMADAFYGRARAYEEALKEQDNSALQAALARNIYGGESPSGHNLVALAGYVRQAVELLAQQPTEKLLQSFPLPLGNQIP